MFHVFGGELLLDAILRTRTGRIVLATLACLGSTTIAVLMVPIELRAIELARSHVETDAEVTDSQETQSSDLFDRTTYSVRYRFTVDGRVYHKTAPYGDAWSKLPKEEYDAATALGRGHVRVAYAPADPWNNDLARDLPWMRAYAIAWLVGIVSVTAAAWFWAGRVATNEARRWVGVQSAPV